MTRTAWYTFASFPVDTHPLISENISLDNILNKIIRVRGSSACSTVALSLLSVTFCPLPPNPPPLPNPTPPPPPPPPPPPNLRSTSRSWFLTFCDIPTQEEEEEEVEAAAAVAASAQISASSSSSSITSFLFSFFFSFLSLFFAPATRERKLCLCFSTRILFFSPPFAFGDVLTTRKDSSSSSSNPSPLPLPLLLWIVAVVVDVLPPLRAFKSSLTSNASSARWIIVSSFVVLLGERIFAFNTTKLSSLSLFLSFFLFF